MGLHLIGAVLNGFIALLYIFGGRHMLADRIDKIVLGLLVICCLWSIATNARLFVDLSYPDASVGSITGATSSIVITLLVGANVLLAMERYFISRGTSPSASAKYHIASMSFSSLLCAVIIGVFATS
ncbi:hypothetical protein BDR26DRAFT_619273 [Obelidium mucronatum]|nr:hypothetical protein BDR26DRAFT_619273 [Obelidium mucronatum]